MAGFRVLVTAAWGRALFLDDLSTHPAAGRRGLAGQLLDWIAADAISLRCHELHLESSLQAERADAHRLYLNHGCQIGSHHFARSTQVDPPPGNRAVGSKNAPDVIYSRV